MTERQPIFNAPTVVIATLAIFLAVQVAADPDYGLLSEELRARLGDLLAFYPERLGSRGDEVPGGRLAGATQYVTHMFMHGDFTHLAINSAWFLAFGTAVARRVGAARFLAFFLVCGIGGALLFLPFNAAPMVGASGGIAGLMGAVLRFLFVPLGDNDTEALAGRGDQPPLMGLGAALTDRRILIAIAAWTALNVLLALAAPTVFGGRNVAWEAHLGGFFTGLLTFGLFDRRTSAATPFSQ